MREAMRAEDTPTRLRAAQAVLRMSGLGTAAPTTKEPTREEIIKEFISEAIGEVTVELGVNGMKRLPGGNEAGDANGTGSGE